MMYDTLSQTRSIMNSTTTRKALAYLAAVELRQLEVEPEVSLGVAGTSQFHWQLEPGVTVTLTAVTVAAT